MYFHISVYWGKGFSGNWTFLLKTFNGLEHLMTIFTRARSWWKTKQTCQKQETHLLYASDCADRYDVHDVQPKGYDFCRKSSVFLLCCLRTLSCRTVQCKTRQLLGTASDLGFAHSHKKAIFIFFAIFWNGSKYCINSFLQVSQIYLGSSWGYKAPLKRSGL